MTKTNRKHYRIEKYTRNDFEFLISYISETNEFYIFPIEFVLKKKSQIIISKEQSQRPISAKYRSNWDLIRGHLEGILNDNTSNSGKALLANPEPSLRNQEGVET